MSNESVTEFLHSSMQWCRVKYILIDNNADDMCIYMKNFSFLFLVMALVFVPQIGFALSLESFYVTGDDERKFKTAPASPAGGIKACGYLVVSEIPQSSVKEYVKMSLSMQNDSYDADPPIDNYRKNALSSYVDLAIGRVDKNKGFVEYEVTSARIAADWLSRQVNLNEFPSSSSQTGKWFVKKLANKGGFTLYVTSPEFEGERTIEIVDKKKFAALSKKINQCDSYMARLNFLNWQKYSKLPTECYYGSKADYCKK